MLMWTSHTLFAMSPAFCQALSAVQENNGHCPVFQFLQLQLHVSSVTEAWTRNTGDMQEATVISGREGQGNLTCKKF